MKNVKLKICGMRNPENILHVAALNPDYMGFIFYNKSPRFVGDDFELPLAFPSTIKKVGVFVNETAANILSIVARLKLEYVQLHGHESVETCQELKGNGVGVIKAFSVDENFDFETVNPYKSVVDYFLFDTKGKYYGGNAQKFDWDILKKYDQQVPFFLSGGITPDDAAAMQAVAGMNVHALDVNSGVEISPAYKDVARIRLLKQSLLK